MMYKMKPKIYKYEIELTQPMFPRHLADCMSLQGNLARTLVSVKDCQRDDHVYGVKYQAKDGLPDVESMTYKQMLSHYTALWSQSHNTPEREAFDWILALVEREGNENMGLVTSYLKEFLTVLQGFQARCETVGKFAEEPTQ